MNILPNLLQTTWLFGVVFDGYNFDNFPFHVLIIPFRIYHEIAALSNRL